MKHVRNLLQNIVKNVRYLLQNIKFFVRFGFFRSKLLNFWDEEASTGYPK
jgi:hypothetical protein